MRQAGMFFRVSMIVVHEATTYLSYRFSKIRTLPPVSIGHPSSVVPNPRHGSLTTGNASTFHRMLPLNIGLQIRWYPAKDGRVREIDRWWLLRVATSESA